MKGSICESDEPEHVTIETELIDVLNNRRTHFISQCIMCVAGLYQLRVIKDINKISGNPDLYVGALKENQKSKIKQIFRYRHYNKNNAK